MNTLHEVSNRLATKLCVICDENAQMVTEPCIYKVDYSVLWANAGVKATIWLFVTPMTYCPLLHSNHQQ